MLENAIDRLNSLGLWPEAVPGFLRRPETLRWLAEVQREAGRSTDEIVLLLLCAMRSFQLTLLDGGTDPQALGQFLVDHDEALRALCRTKHVQANIAERALPILEVLGDRWGRQKLSVVELGCSFGLIGRVLVSATSVLQQFDRYFLPTQQRPHNAPLVIRYQGIDLDPPDERWFLSCIPMAELRTRMARFIFEVPAEENCRINKGSAFDVAAWPAPAEGSVPVILTSFFLYQLTPEAREALVTSIKAWLVPSGGTWINLDVLVADGKARFVLQEDGIDRLDLDSDLCAWWKAHG